MALFARSAAASATVKTDRGNHIIFAAILHPEIKGLRSGSTNCDKCIFSEVLMYNSERNGVRSFNKNR
jgi:hypothetical protein